jgi:putative ABC transport system permease protein
MTLADYIRQSRALMPVAAANSWRSRWASLTIIVCTLLVVVVVAAFLSMASGFEATTKAAGSDRVIVILGVQSTSESNSQISGEQLSILSEIAQQDMRDQITAISPELTFTVGGTSSVDGRRINMPLRGLDEAGRTLRSGFRMIAGRQYQSGAQEIIAGRRLYREIGSPPLNSSITLGGRDWTLVGVFELDSAVFEWDYWTDLGSMQSAYGRQNQVQAVRIGVKDPGVTDGIQTFVDADPRLSVDVWTERQLYERQGENVARLIRYLGWPLALILAAGCIAGILNTMFISMQSRRRSLGTLRIMGYAPVAIVTSVVVEGCVLAVVGAIFGLLVVFVALDGLDASMIGASFMTVDYDMQLTMKDVVLSLMVALVIGSLGSIIPAGKAVKI